MIKNLSVFFCSICLYSNVFANDSIVMEDWLISFENKTCWASALIIEDHSKEYDPDNDFQYTVSFHNGIPLPQFTIVSNSNGKVVTAASIKFDEYILDYEVIEDTAFSFPKDDRKILFNMLDGLAPKVIMKINHEDILPTPSVSLKGFKAAYNFMSKKCNLDNSIKAMEGIS